MTNSLKNAINEFDITKRVAFLINNFTNKEIDDLMKEKERQLKSKKKEALTKLDKNKFGWFHVKTIIVSGMGFFTVN